MTGKAAVGHAAPGEAVEAVAQAQEQVCPGTVVLAARGSDQNEQQGESFGSQKYSENSEVSDGFEGPNFIELFHQVEQRYQGTMDDVYVLALDDKAYPASMDLPPLAQEGEELELVQVIVRAVEIVQQYPVGEMLRSVTIGFIDSARAGMCNAPKVVRDYEDTTGCKPQYVVAGFSQDALGEVPRGDEAFEGRGNHRQSTAQVSVGDGTRSAASRQAGRLMP